ncbi:hypothetical protein [Nocardia sp. NPDC004260]
MFLNLHANLPTTVGESKANFEGGIPAWMTRLLALIGTWRVRNPVLIWFLFVAGHIFGCHLGMILPMAEANSERFGQIVKNRRLKLGLTQDQVHELGGPSDRRQTFIETNTGPRPSITTLAKLDRPLRWEPGSAVRTWNGGDPREAAYESLDVELLKDLEGALDRHEVYRLAARRLRLGPEGSQIDAGAVNLLLHLLTDLLNSLTDVLNSPPTQSEGRSRAKPTS